MRVAGAARAQRRSSDCHAFVLTATRTPYGTLPDGTPIAAITLAAADGLTVVLLEYGATLARVRAPDRHGRVDDVVLTLPSLDAYVTHDEYLGATVGRVAGRIAEARYVLDGREVRLLANAGPHALHGGPAGFDRRAWAGEAWVDARGAHARFTLTSPDGDQGHPGRLDAATTFTVHDAHTLAVTLEATTDRATPVNLVQHAYWNLAGLGARGASDDLAPDVRDHDVMVAADRVVEASAALLPTGRVLAVTGTPFDLRAPTRLGTLLDASHPQLVLAGGVDHSWLRAPARGALGAACTVAHAASGRRLTVHTTEPGVHLYAANGFDGTLRAPDGRRYPPHAGLAIEAQHVANAVNDAAFPSILLRPGATWRSVTHFQLSVDGA